MTVGTLGFVLSLGIGAAQPAEAQKITKTLADYIAAADPVCAETNVALSEASKKIETEHARSTKGGRIKKVLVAKPASVANYVAETAVPALEKLGSDLRAIPVPADQSKLVLSLLDSFEAEVAVLKKNPKSAIYTNPMKESSKAFVAAGFKACGSHIDRAAATAKK